MSTALLSALQAAETAVWQALVTGDADADARALADTFLGVYPDGFANKGDHVGQLQAGPTIAAFALDDLRVTPMGPDHAILSYRARYTRTGRAAQEVMYVSSGWQRERTGDGLGWINVFSQDTPAQG